MRRDNVSASMGVGRSIAALALSLGLASAAAAATPPSETAQVLVQGFSFQPPAVAIVTEGSVTWTVGTDPEQHTVTPREPGAFEGSDQLFTGDTFTVTFNRAGSIEYFCSLHPNMVGTVEVSVPESTVAPIPPTAPTASPPPSELPSASETAPDLTLVVVAAAAAVVALVVLLTRRRA